MNSRALSNKLMTTDPLLISILLNYEKKEISKKIRLMFGDDKAREKFSPARDSQSRVDYYNLPELESKMFVAKHNLGYLEKITQFWIDRNKVAVLPDFTHAAEATRA
ncbi:hypothetical protein ACGRH2_03515 [Vibrio barjaei]|uniref:Pyocin activator protein PrtN n=1 Tax=Vibrio barjaei TaxID=1676683 RepID=A0ABW7IFM3_9VIBR